MKEIVRDPTNNDFVDGTITYKEVLKSIKAAQNGKSAGSDGILYVMLKALPKKTLTDKVAMFNFAHTHGVCPEIWHHAVIAHLYKKVIASTQTTPAQLFFEVQLQKFMRLPFSHELDMSSNGDGTHHRLINLTSDTTLNARSS